MSDRPPIHLLVVGISLSALSLCLRSPARPNPESPSAHTDDLARSLSARAIVIDPTTQAVTLAATGRD